MVNSETQLNLESKRIRRLNRTTKDWVWNSWNQYPPEWFITLLWNDLPTDPIKASTHSRHFRNVFLCNLYTTNQCSKVPKFPDRLGITVFQERTETQGKITFHSHFHLSNTNGRWSNHEEVKFYLKHKIGKRVMKLLKSDTPGNEGIKALDWVQERHMAYNFKEIDRKRYVQMTRYTQDGDLLLDVELSDLLPLQESTYGHQTPPKRQN